jgi:GT2 family glycosyltransferase
MSARSSNADDITLVIITHNRAQEVLRTVEYAVALQKLRRIIVVDNASEDGTAPMLCARFPNVLVVRLRTNLGAAARNIGVTLARTAYVALCDDDTWWHAGALAQAQHLLNRYSRIAILCAQVIVEPLGRIDPTCLMMERSPLDSNGLPGAALLGFLAGASVVRRSAFLAAGGFEPRFFIGGEEELLALDLASQGWAMSYVPEVVVHHQPSARRDAGTRRHLLLRNMLYLAWLRLPLKTALRESFVVLCRAARERVLLDVMREILRALPWLVRERRVIPPAVRHARQLVRRHTARFEPKREAVVARSLKGTDAGDSAHRAAAEQS